MFSVSLWADKQCAAFLQGAELPEKNIVIGIGATTLLAYAAARCNILSLQTFQEISVSR